MYVEFTIRVTVEVPDNANAENLRFGDMGTIVVDRMNHNLIDYETENCVKLEDE